MGFYGNIGDTSRIHFQFDKIFKNRKEMDLACANGTDHVYQGRFVLVKYDDTDTLFSGDLLYGFTSSNNLQNVILYQDSLQQHPYKYTQYILVNNPNKNDYLSYYEKKKIGETDFYIKLTNASQVKNENAYYRKEYSDSDRVGINTIIYNKNASNKNADGKFYICTGENQETHMAYWSLISDYSLYGDYLSNFQIDLATYGEDFDSRGYDATVWEKTYSEGIGRYIQIARLNSFIPSLEIIADKPTVLPTSAYFDAQSQADNYIVHVPSNWGFRIKEAKDNEPSEQTINQLQYNIEDQTVEEQFIRGDIYFNLNHKDSNNNTLSHNQYKLYDSSTENNISITPTGKSGKKYNGNVETDTYELSVHFPIVGNMISDGYDIIYGANTPDPDTGKISRPTDINWYDGSASNETKQLGNSSIGGKTHNLNTLAGTINTAHDVLGQIVVNLSNMPTQADIENYSSNLLYKYNNSYYRKGIAYTLNAVDDYRYTLAQNVTSTDFKLNKYYIYSNNTYVPATTYNSNQNYYLKNINFARYTPIALEQYAKGLYYWKNGENYICDQNENIPSLLNTQYYKNLVTQSYIFQSAYTIDTYYTNDNGNYKLSHTSNPTSQIYYEINSYGETDSILYYKENIYYYQERNSTDISTGTYHPADQSHVFNKQKNIYYKFTFDTSRPQYGLKDGQVVQYYPTIGQPENVTDILYEKPSDINNYYILLNANDPSKKTYVSYNNIQDLGLINGQNPYTIPRVFYKLTITPHNLNTMFLPGVYYELDSDGSYTKAYTWHNGYRYYIIQSDELVTKKFYVPDKYYYKDSQYEVYHLDSSITPTHNVNNEYYTKTALYVISDTTGQCPRGYEWSDLSGYVPPSVTLGALTETPALIKINELNDNTDTLYGLVLQLNKMYAIDDEISRDPKTIRGMYNSLKDILSLMNKFKPNSVLYINEFGQIESSNFEDYTKLKNILTKYNQIMNL